MWQTLGRHNYPKACVTVRGYIVNNGARPNNALRDYIAQTIRMLRREFVRSDVLTEIYLWRQVVGDWPSKVTLASLRASVQQSSNFRGHQLIWDGKLYDTVQYGYCVKCDAEVRIDTKPPPNGIDISGELIALSCKEHYDARA